MEAIALIKVFGSAGDRQNVRKETRPVGSCRTAMSFEAVIVNRINYMKFCTLSKAQQVGSNPSSLTDIRLTNTKRKLTPVASVLVAFRRLLQSVLSHVRRLYHETDGNKRVRSLWGIRPVHPHQQASTGRLLLLRSVRRPSSAGQIHGQLLRLD